jgi:hypothetical protein
VFGRLRQRHSFSAAVAATVPLIALTHVPIIVEGGWTVGIAAIVVAAVTCYPLARLYELGNRTIWPCVLVHAAIDGFSLIAHPARPGGLAVAVAGAALVVPFLALAWTPRSQLSSPAVHVGGKETS